MTAKGKLGHKLADVTDCCNRRIIADGKVPDGTAPDPDGTMAGTFHYADAQVSPFLKGVEKCLKGKNYACNATAAFPSQPAFLGSTLTDVIVAIGKKTQ